MRIQHRLINEYEFLSENGTSLNKPNPLPIFFKPIQIIKRRGGETFKIIFTKSARSPFNVPGIKIKATTKDILDAVIESWARTAESGSRGFIALEPLLIIGRQTTAITNEYGTIFPDLLGIDK